MRNNLEGLSDAKMPEYSSKGALEAEISEYNSECREKTEMNECGLDSSRNLRVFKYSVCDSTNTRAREYATELLKNGGLENPMDDTGLCAVFLAERQTAGRGRRGRSFLSEQGGIYISFLFLGEWESFDVGGITARAAVIAARAIESVTKVKIDIKWVNDLYVNDKKVAGILTEGEFDGNGKLRCFVVGMGINVYKIVDFEQILPIATTLEDEADEMPDKDKICNALMTAMAKDALLEEDGFMLCEYRSRCMLLGRTVTVHRGDEMYSATVLGVDDDYSLKVMLDSGENRSLNSGEVSIRF